MMQHTRPEHRVKAEPSRAMTVVLVVWAVIATALLLVTVLAPVIRA